MRIYEQLKIHKKDIPIRFIFSVIGVPTYALAHFLINQLQAFTSNTPSFFQYSSDITKKNWHLHFDEHDIMFSFDVVSLFNKIFFPKALELMFKIVDQKTLHLVEIFLTSTFFTFKDACYE